MTKFWKGAWNENLGLAIMVQEEGKSSQQMVVVIMLDKEAAHALGDLVIEHLRSRSDLDQGKAAEA